MEGIIGENNNRRVNKEEITKRISVLGWADRF